MVMKPMWICFVVFLAVVGYVASRPPDNSEQKQIARDAARETNADEDLNTVPVIARGVSVVPGAIVCPNLASVQLMFSLYTESVTEDMQDAMSRGQSRLLRGEPMPKPDFKVYGCALLPSGTPMRLDKNNSNGGWSVVSAKLTNGKTIRGVTLESMIVGTELQKWREQGENAREQAGTQLQQRYEEIMQPEIERHAAAVKQENDRHSAVMRQLNPFYVDMFLGMTLDQVSPQQRRSVDCLAENCRDEEDRHIAAIQEENQQHDSAQRAARRQAARLSQPTSQ